jgi:hypothetical protein
VRSILAEAKDFEAITGKGVTGTVEIRKLHWEIKPMEEVNASVSTILKVKLLQSKN